MSSPYALTYDTPLARYRTALAAGDYQPDAAQQRAVEALDEIHRRWTARWHTAGPAAWRTRLPRWLGGRRIAEPIVGLYLWGGVGRGKTWLMDLFFDTLPGQRKQRLHFHRFMLWVHESLADKQGQADPLSALADALSAQADVLCFDEFFVTDIGDAMLLGTLLPALFTRGVTLVATSNIPPAQLYPNGLQRGRFLPAIAQIQTHCQVLNVDGGTDYRLRTLTRAHLYLTPLGADTEQAMDALFLRLAGQAGQIGGTLTINHRPLPVLRRAEAVVALHFSALCEAPCSSRDYIALAQRYHTVLLYGVSTMGADREACARRFLALVDEFYERRVTLIISAACDMCELYRGERLAFEYQRCLSRLQEMQSEAYLSLPHRP
ncbi:cell division protein ZapE [Edwardsiella anguillarum]|uniref:Cell division protein ZapE n=1 Tax=Edwardsiella anguillarum ET080813 TaxID=667120 RepID=A0A076LPR7_9GAMM|nr:ATPase, AFG1 family [Edwardsiella anguillarum ET080813]AKM45977.1 ATPase [Edwardsiella sp. EA181011]KAB0592843.1 AFG1 family ATPase [Edwardsiella anguillarum]GAJ66982.1 ATPase [Edwardsiella piscicida]RFT00852.1 cell division protein ZapE [Edwardsiella anguillarum]